MQGSGFADILLEATLISSGSLQGVMSGKNYSRAIRCHKVLFESLYRLLARKFLDKEGHVSLFKDTSEEVKNAIEDLENNPSTENLDNFLELNEVCVTEFNEFCEKTRHGYCGKTGQFWMAYMDHVSLVLSLMRAVKYNDFELYGFCIGQ